MVDHEVPLKKLFNCGIRGIVFNLFKSYLCNRHQSVKVNGFVSDPVQIEVGVPQGSILGPILFSIYFNSFCCLRFTGNLIAFADDSAFNYVGSSWSEIHTYIEMDLKQIVKWFNLHCLVLSKKTKYIKFYCGDRGITSLGEIDMICHSFDCSGSCSDSCFIIDRVNVFRYLGILLDSQLSYKQHITAVKNKLLPLIRLFYLLRNLVPFNLLQSLYFALFHSRLEYCVAIWGGVYFENIKQLFILQKFAIRIITFKKRRVSSFKLFVICRVLPLRYIFIYKVLKIFYFRGGYRSVRLVERYNMRTPNLCFVPFTRREYCKRFYTFIAPHIFNKLPPLIKLAIDGQKFLGILKNWLISLTYCDVEMLL